MDKFIRIYEFAKVLFSDQKTAGQASQIIVGILEGRSPRLSDIAARMPGSEAASYKKIQRFLRDDDPQAIIQRGSRFCNR